MLFLDLAIITVKITIDRDLDRVAGLVVKLLLNKDSMMFHPAEH